MQLPNAKTPVAKCVQLALYSQRMLGKFPDNPVLTALSTKMAAAGQKLSDAQTTYTAAVVGIVTARVDVKFADYAADEGVRRAQRAAETADGGKGGPIASTLFPNGMTPMIKPVGATQVQEMRDLEGRFDAVASRWPEAAAEKAKIIQLRTGYEGALEARRAAGQQVSDLRAARNVGLEDFLDVYAEIANRVKAEFPRNRKMQELFFDKIWTNDEHEEQADEPEEGQEGSPEPA